MHCKELTAEGKCCDEKFVAHLVNVTMRLMNDSIDHVNNTFRRWVFTLPSTNLGRIFWPISSHESLNGLVEGPPGRLVASFSHSHLWLRSLTPVAPSWVDQKLWMLHVGLHCYAINKNKRGCGRQSIHAHNIDTRPQHRYTPTACYEMQRATNRMLFLPS